MILQLQQTVKSGLLGHAYLFLGPKDKTMENALSFAQAVNCISPVDGRGCQVCLSCRKISHGNHPDVIITDPEGTSFKIEQGRELQKKLSYKHYEAKYKVLILRGADLMTVAAANSMLKILEEPPEQTMFILTGENGDNILPTVLSRCQVIKFGPEEGEAVEGSEVEIEQAIDLVQNLPQGDYCELLKISESWEKNRENVKKFLEAILIWFRDVAVAKLTNKPALVENKNKWDMLLNSPLTADAALLAAQEVERSQKLLGQNANLRLVLDVMFIRLYRICG
ncbi:MAG: ATP-binding protein [Bacillota bacterium]|jgi:DNA polymerase-3 subunit delta'|nr:DNA polymerase III subunit [Clostridia bacterium]